MFGCELNVGSMMILSSLRLGSCSPGFNAWEWVQAILHLDYCSFLVVMVLVNLLFVLLLLVHVPATLFLDVQRVGKSNSEIRALGCWHKRAEWICWVVCSMYGVLGVKPLLLHWWKDNWQEFPLQELLFLLVQWLAWLAISVALRREQCRKRAIHSNLLRAWWVAILTASAYGLCVTIWRRTDDTYLTLVESGLVGLPMVSSLFLVKICLTGSMYKDGRSSLASEINEPLLGENGGPFVSEYYSAGAFKRSVFAWMNPLLTLGNIKPLQLSDVRALSNEDDARANSDAFQACWEEEKLRTPPPALPSIWWTLWKVYWKPFMFSVILIVIQAAVMFAGPIMLNRIVSFMAAENRSSLEGITLVATLFLSKLVEGLTVHHFAFNTQRLGLRMWAGVGGAMYGKITRLSQKVRLTRSVGEITNMMSIDVQRLISLIWFLQQGLVLPIQITIAMVVLYKVVGFAMFTGLATLFALLVVNIFIVGSMRKYRMKILELKDRRMRVTTESLSNMKVLKLQSWEDRFLKQIEDLREIERCWLARFMFTWAFSIFMVWLGPLAASAVTFLTVVLRGGPLNTARVFTAITTFRILQEPVRFTPDVFSNVIQASVSLQRIREFLCEDEVDENAVQNLTNDSESNFAVDMENASFAWDKVACVPVVQNLKLKIVKGTCVAVCGGVGSGKSSLLYSILGELPRLTGSAKLCGTVAYVAQTAWIQNNTIRENVLFGRAMEPTRYHEALRVSGLLTDLAQFPGGDATEIGERGINMSGGQKQRIQLARAVYQDADVYLLDDPFSAVDAHTGTHLFEECVKGALKGKTVVLVTHQVEFLPGTDLILVVKDGEVVQSGSYDNLVQEGRDFGMFVDALATSLKSVGVQVKTSLADRHLDDAPLARVRSLEREDDSESERILARNFSTNCASNVDSADVRSSSAKLIEEEERETGRVNSKIIFAYLTRAYKGLLTLVVISLQVATYGFQVGSDSWLAGGTSEEGKTESLQFIAVYVLLTAGCACAVLTRTSLVAFLGLATAQAFFLGMIRNIFRAPLSYFDSTPLGRILSRSSTDQTSLDMELPNISASCINNIVGIIGAVAVTSFATPQLLFLVLPLAIFYGWLQIYYITMARELTRLTSLTEAPLFLHVGESIAGASTIRAFKEQQRFMDTNTDRFRSYQRSVFHFVASSSWLGVRLETLGSLVLSSAAFLLVVLPRDSFNPGLAGLSLSYGLSLNAVLMRLVYFLNNFENKLVAVERISQYSKVPSEKPAIIPDKTPPHNWPNEGRVELRNLQVRYRPGSPLVLNGISCLIEPREKVGVVGRTGSGKSTLVQALFRLIEPAGGKIIIDGIDICTIGLKDLRSRLSVIPQEPTLFEGSVRNNLDPLAIYSDDLIWEALEKCQLLRIVAEKPEKLDSPVSEQGGNWSVGERQLLCLGRALLRQARILVLDEATASVDIFTDAVLQNTIRRHFANCTVISVAHRIPTVINSDRVLVLDAGRLMENSSPERLLASEDSLFSKLVHEYTAHAGSGGDIQQSGES